MPVNRHWWLELGLQRLYFPRMTDDHDRPTRQPTHEALWPADLFTQGIGWVIVARFKAKGQRVQASIFLVDVFCLGANLAVYEDCDIDDYASKFRAILTYLTWTPETIDSIFSEEVK